MLSSFFSLFIPLSLFSIPSLSSLLRCLFLCSSSLLLFYLYLHLPPYSHMYSFSDWAPYKVTETVSLCSETVGHDVNTTGSTTTITTVTQPGSCGIAGTTETTATASSTSAECYKFPMLFHRHLQSSVTLKANSQSGSKKNIPTRSSCDEAKETRTASKGSEPVLVLSDFDSLEMQGYYYAAEHRYARMGQNQQPFVPTEHVCE